MKKLIYIFILLTSLAKAQNPAPLFNVGKYVITDEHAHYMTSVNLSSFISSSAYYLTKRPLISGLIGISASFLVGMGKEFIYDEKLGKGTKSVNDMDKNGRGSVAGGLFSFGISDTIDKKRNKIDSLKYQFNTQL